MPKRLDSLTQAQKDRMPSFVQDRIAYALRTTPLTAEEWEVWEEGARACYVHANVPWPNKVIRVTSPKLGALVAATLSLLPELDAMEFTDSAVHGDVESVVGAELTSNISATELKKASREVLSSYVGGRFWAGSEAYISFMVDECGLELEPDIMSRKDAWLKAQSTGWWWPFREFVVVSDLPSEINLEPIPGANEFRRRLHNANGPAISWPDWNIHSWHGTVVPADLINPGWDAERILKEPNVEIRRCAIEVVGWDRFIAEAKLQQIGEAVADPGNPAQTLTLYDAPQAIYGEPVKVLMCTNGTPERDGTRHQFGLTVPASIISPVAAAAWTYGLNPTEYAQLARRA